jgi:hypothetical protein
LVVLEGEEEGLLLLLLLLLAAKVLLLLLVRCFLPVSLSTAVQAMKAAHISRPNCRFSTGMPVSAERGR